MRKPIIAGNWKMNKTAAEAEALINELKPLVAKSKPEVVLCVPFVDIPAAIEAAKGSNIKIGAENVHFKASGAYTGEIAANMLVELDDKGVKNIILDLRNNPGGYLVSAVEIAQMTVPEGIIVQTMYRQSENNITYYSELKEPKYKFAIFG